MNVRLGIVVGLCLNMTLILTACGSSSNESTHDVDTDSSSALTQSAPDDPNDAPLESNEGDGTDTSDISSDKPASPVEEAYPEKPLAEAVTRQPLQLTDEGPSSADFVAFRNTLRQAIQNRDAAFIRAIASPDIHLTFGLPITIEELDLDNPNAGFWRNMEKAIATGCASEIFGIEPERETWICPHVFLAPDTLPSIDSYEHIVIVGETINVRVAPDASSPVIDTVSNEVVRHDTEGSVDLTVDQQRALSTVDGWQPIITSTGNRGYVSSRYAYSPIGYRAFFTQDNDAWQMTVFIAGD